MGLATNATGYFLNATNDAEYSAAITSAATWGVKVVNISAGIADSTAPTNGASLGMYTALQNLSLAGGTCVAAAGNNGYAPNTYPAGYTAYNLAIGVGGANSSGTLSYIGGTATNTANVDIYAPCGGGSSSNPTAAGNGYDLPIGDVPSGSQDLYILRRGTSLSAGMVTGLVAGMYKRGKSSSVVSTKNYLSTHYYNAPVGHMIDAIVTLQ